MIKVLQTGFYTTIQDLGRLNFQEYGVPNSGTMDIYSAKIANAVLGNDASAAVLEITMTGPKLEFNCETTIAISGAAINPMLNNKSILMNTAISITKGDTLSFGKLVKGFRSYLAVKDGFQNDVVLDSRSMYRGITDGARIKRNEELKISCGSKNVFPHNASIKTARDHFDSKIIEVYKGPEFDDLDTAQKEFLFAQQFTIAKENSRMAYQLEELLSNNINAIITSLVMPGTVQLTPAGKLIILMRDCQTTGGYPRILQLKETSINRLSQKYTAMKIKFRLLQ